MTGAPTDALTLCPIEGRSSIVLTGYRALVAGYTGRDQDQVRRHIDELAAIGVPPPPQVPMLYPMPSTAVTTAQSMTTDGDNTSGEVEPVLIRYRGRNYLGVGSDHTDRTLETVDIARSKQACPKPLGTDILEITDWSAFDWDGCHTRSWVDGTLYQEGALSGLLRPGTLLGLLADQVDGFDHDEDFICFAGTLPLLGGEFVPGRKWNLELTLPDGRSLRHSYHTTSPEES